MPQMPRLPRTTRALLCCAFISSLAACVVTPPPRSSAPPPAPRPNPHEVAVERRIQIDQRLDTLSHRIDARVNEGYYPPPVGAGLHHRLDVIRQEERDMAAQHDGGLSGDEQRVLNQELDGAARAIGN